MVGLNEETPKPKAEVGSVSLTYDPTNLCDYCDSGPPQFTWNEGDWSDWNGGARLCYECAEKTVREHVQYLREWNDEEYVQPFRIGAAAVLAHSQATKG